MAAIVYQTSKQTGIIYAYESASYWDKEKQQSRAKRRCIGRMDPETKEIIPTRKRVSAANAEHNEDALKGEPVPITDASRGFYGATHLFDAIGEKLGIIADLKKCFPDSYKQLLSIAYYLILEDSNPLSRFPKWAAGYAFVSFSVLYAVNFFLVTLIKSISICYCSVNSIFKYLPRRNTYNFLYFETYEKCGRIIIILFADIKASNKEAIMLKIDMHVHIVKWKDVNRLGTKSTFTTPNELLKMYEKLGIQKGLILPVVNPECCFGVQSIGEILDIVAEYPENFSWFCNIDPRAGKNSSDMDMSYMLEYYKSLGAKGLGEICANLYFDDPLVENLFYHCEKCNMPVLFHIGPQVGGCYGLVDEVGLHRLEKELEKFSKLKFIGHSQPFWAEISTDVNDTNRNSYPGGKVTSGRIVELLRKYPNLYADMSAGSGYNAISRDPEFGYAFIEEFQDKLFFGTDICAPENDMKLSFWLDDALKDRKISEIAYEKVCRLNALKILG